MRDDSVVQLEAIVAELERRSAPPPETGALMDDLASAINRLAEAVSAIPASIVVATPRRVRQVERDEDGNITRVVEE